MKKSERINDLLMYLNDKKVFKLREIMNQYGISKSTALRDIQSLEELGMPIYSQTGRNGCYRILPNRLLSPIVFTMEEVKALYFAMQTLNAYQSTPFHLNITTLKRKFEGCISEKRMEELHNMERIFRLGSYQNQSICNYLGDIVEMTVNESVCMIDYNKKDFQKQYYVQFFDITSAYGQWYATAYNFQTQKPQVFRCDKITSIAFCDHYHSKSLTELLTASSVIFRELGAVDFQVVITSQGADLFYKEHYPSMVLEQVAEGYQIKGFYNKGEEDFIANYFLMYRETLLSVQPDCLKTLILDRIEAIKYHLTAKLSEQSNVAKHRLEVDW